MLVYDLETDGFRDQMTRVHCLNIFDRETLRAWRFNRGQYDDGTPCPRDGSIEDGVRMLEQAETIGGHNIIGFDNPILADFYSFAPRPDQKVRDSLIEARVIWTNIWDIDDAAIKKGQRPPLFAKVRAKPHSLEAWGIRLGVLKGIYSGGWEHWTPDMDVYADQDPIVTAALFDRIDAKGYSRQCLELENAVAGIIFLQEEFGFAFNSTAAEALSQELSVRKAELEDQLRATFKPWFVAERYKGQHVVMDPKRDDKKLGRTKGVTFTKIEEVVFNPGSRAHIADRMIKLFGWAPQEFTPTGLPEVNETTLDGIDAPEAKMLVEYLTVEKRLGMVSGGKEAWLSKVKADGRIHGRVNTNGAVTGRMTHSTPNVAQTPKVKLLGSTILKGYAGGWGYECRSCWFVPPGKVLVGCDAEGLELRMLGHYMSRFDGGAYSEAVVNGTKDEGTDAHSVNMKAIGLRSRDNAKTWAYAFLYGAGAYKLGTIVLEDMTEDRRTAFFAKNPAGEKREKAIARLGLRSKQGIEEGLPALGQLIALVKDKAKRGFLKGLDGRLIHVRSQHSALNALLQSAGAVLMKAALVHHHQKCLSIGWVHGREWGYVANVHDEAQMECLPTHAEECGQLFADAIRLAGEALALKCPMSGAFNIGPTWASSH